ncbi:MAG: S53 family peptidase [Acidimicrobiales bacterium]
MTLALSPVLAASAGASGSNPNSWTPVAQGVSATAVPGATPFTGVPGNTSEQVSFILDERNAGLLSWEVENGDPNFLSVSQFAQEFGQTQSNINALESYLSGFGITSNAYANGIDISTTGTASEYNAALSVTQDQYHAPWTGGFGRGGGTQTFHGATTDPQLPYRLASFVEGVLGLTNYSPFSSSAVQATKPAHVTATGGTTTSAWSASACEALAGLPAACNLPQDFESNYGLNRLEHQANGSGVTIGIVTLAALDVGAPEVFWNTVANIPNTGRTVTVQNVDNGPTIPPGLTSYDAGSGETDLDVEQSGAVAPGANVIVYQAPNTDSGFVDAFAQAASQNIASTISCSWGESESVINYAISQGEETTAYQGAFDEMFQEMAIQGQSGFVSAGDAGAYDDSDELGTTELTVDSPGNSPYITTGGGTTLPWSATFLDTGTGLTAPVTVSAQRAWGWDYIWQPIATITGLPESEIAESEAAGGGGGFSTIEATPSYQQGVSGTHLWSGVQYLQPTDYTNVSNTSTPFTLPEAWNFNATPSVSHGFGNGRAVPDLSTDADPETGYLEYSPSFTDSDGPGPILEGGWGGTSFVAPQLNGTTALIDSALGHRVGFWNPTIYGAAQGWNSPFTPLSQAGTSNDNLFYTGTPGTIYNEATGLGIPNLGALARDFN